MDVKHVSVQNTKENEEFLDRSSLTGRLPTLRKKIMTGNYEAISEAIVKTQTTSKTKQTRQHDLRWINKRYGFLSMGS